MGFDPTVRTETFGGSDKSWIRMREGLDDMLPGMLDMSAFTANHVVNGKIPSGIALAKITAAPGFFGPYAGRVNEVQSITVDATGGTFTITHRGTATAAISATATAAAVQAALELLAEVGIGDIVVSGGPGNAGGTTPYLLTFKGQYKGQNVAQVTTAAGSLTGGAGTATVATVTAGGAGASDGTEVFFGHLFEDCPVRSGPLGAPVTPDVSTAKDAAIAVFWDGVVIESKLPTFPGGETKGLIDANAKLDNPNMLYI